MRNTMKFSIQIAAWSAACAFLLSMSACGGGEEDSASNADIGNAAPNTATCNNSTFPDQMGGYQNRLNANPGDVQCRSQIQAAESYRQAAIANCAAGDTAGATGNYGYYKQSIPLVNFYCK